MIGMDANTVENILKKLETDRKIMFFNGYVAIKNKKNYWGKLKGKFLVNVFKALDKSPNEIKDFIDYDSLCIEYQYSIDRPLKNKEHNTYNKEHKEDNKTKNGINGKTITDFYCQQYLEFNQTAYPIDFARDRKIMKTLLLTYTADILKTYITTFVKPEYKMWNDKKDIPAFKIEVEKIARSTGKENKVKFMPEVL